LAVLAVFGLEDEEGDHEQGNKDEVNLGQGKEAGSGLEGGSPAFSRLKGPTRRVGKATAEKD
jgi:hypothetical protein